MPTLDWLNRARAFETAAQVPYRLLKVEAHHGQPSDNLLIQGDNLEALKSLMPFYRGRVKCVFIDPPYNTKSAFEHYDDNLEHAQWLSLMLPRLQLLRELLAEDGSIWVTIDDHEGHYLKVLMDEVFGRGNFVANVVWQKRTSPDARIQLGDAHDHVLVYIRDAKSLEFNPLTLDDEQKARFKNPDNDPRGPWVSTDFSAQGFRPNQMYAIRTPGGSIYEPPPGMCWKNTEEKFLAQVAEGRFWFGKDGRGVPRRKNYLSENEGRSSWSWWTNKEVGHNQESKKEVNELFGAGEAFDTPKPERLLQRILHIATNPGDLVLDSFLGSGTTAAVAHKMGRRWVGIEMGEHARTHCLPRLQKVVAGEQGGISKAVGWQGGGGFRFATLGEPVFGEDGRINPSVRFATLAAFVWQQATGSAFDAAQLAPGTPLLGVYQPAVEAAEPLAPESAPGSIHAPSRPKSFQEAHEIRLGGFAVYLLFNGILGDRRPASGNVLTREVLAALLALHAKQVAANTPLVVFGEACRVGPERLARAKVTFRQIPYELAVR